MERPNTYEIYVNHCKLEMGEKAIYKKRDNISNKLEDLMRKKLTLLSILFFILVQAPVFSVTEENVSKHIIKNVPYHPMLDGFCAMSSLWMNLEYYGSRTEVGKLLNLGWSFGFFYWITPEKIWIYPNTGPVEEIVYAAEALGYDVKEFKHKSLEEARMTLVKYISQNIPVIVQWIGHTVLAYGYENNGDVIIYHNPSDPTSAVVKMESKSGYTDIHENNSVTLKEWEGPPCLWGVFGYHCVVVTPSEKKSDIDWKKIWKRSAEKTLGTEKNPYPAEYGFEGIHALLKDMKVAEFKTEDEMIKYLLNFEGVFFLGAGFRREAAAFLAGRASADNHSALLEAAIAFRESAHLFRRGYNLVLLLKKDPSKASIVKKGYTDILEKIAEFEKSGANALFEAAKTE